MNDPKKHNQFWNYKLPAITAVIVILLIVSATYNSQNQSKQGLKNIEKVASQINNLNNAMQQFKQKMDALALLDKKIKEQEKKYAEVTKATKEMTAKNHTTESAHPWIIRDLKKAKDQLQKAQLHVLIKTTELKDLQSKYEQKKESLASLDKKIAKQEEKYNEITNATKEMTAKNHTAESAHPWIVRDLKKAKDQLQKIQLHIMAKTAELKNLQRKLEQQKGIFASLGKQKEKQYRPTSANEEITKHLQGAEKQQPVSTDHLDVLKDMIEEEKANIKAQQERLAILWKKLDTKAKTLKKTTDSVK